MSFMGIPRVGGWDGCWRRETETGACYSAFFRDGSPDRRSIHRDIYGELPPTCKPSTSSLAGRTRSTVRSHIFILGPPVLTQSPES